MSKISLSFQFDNAAAAAAFLASLDAPATPVATLPVGAATPAPDTPAEAETRRRKRRTNAEIAADEAAAAAAANPPVVAPASAGPAPETAPVADAPAAPSGPSIVEVTFQQVVDALTALMNKHGLPVVVMTLQRFGASKSSDLKPAQYAEIHAYALHQASLASPTVADAAPAPGLPF